MTAEIVEFPAPMTDAELLAEAFAILDRLAGLTSHIPTPFISALRLPEAGTAPATFSGAPITLSKGAGALPYEAINAAWQQVCLAAPPAGSHVHIAGGRVLVDLPDAAGGAA